MAGISLWSRSSVRERRKVPKMKKQCTKREIGDIMKWSPKCREHFFPWKSKAAPVIEAQSIAEAGITECHPGYLLERRAPRFHLLVYTAEGAGEVFDPMHCKPVESGQLLIVPALHPFGYHPKTDTWRFVWFHLSDNDAWAFLRKESLSVRKTMLTGAICEATEGFLRESRGRSDSHQEASGLLIQLAATYIRRELGAGGDNADLEAGNRLDYLSSLVNEDLARSWTVELLAESLGVSCSHLHHMVQKRFKISPMKLVTRLRMERAQELLILHSVPQSVIGELVGYRNEFAFLVAFKRFSGVTPGEFRKRR